MCAPRLLAPLDLDQSFCLILGPWKDPYICLLELEHLGSDKRDSDPSVPFQQSRESPGNCLWPSMFWGVEDRV